MLSGIVGRGGHYVLREHPRCLNIFLHADVKFRQHRVEECIMFHRNRLWNWWIPLIANGRAIWKCLPVRIGWMPGNIIYRSIPHIGMEKSDAIILETFRARFDSVALQTQEAIKAWICPGCAETRWCQECSRLLLADSWHSLSLLL